MYRAHPNLKQPPDDARLWRYTAPTVFLSTLLGGALYFPPLDSFEDPYEGVPPRAVLEAARRGRHPESAAAAHRLAAWKTMIERCRATVCASSWHLGDEESEAMWKLYGRFEDGIAIVSSLKSMRAAFRDTEITGGLVDYSGRDFAPDDSEQNLMRWAATKRASYRHENEFRLLVRRNGSNRGDDGRGGVAVPIEPEVLIEEVVLSPRMERWQVALFRTLLERLAFERSVRESSLLTSPF